MGITEIVKRKFITCAVCGAEFPPLKEGHYITRNKEVVRTGLVSFAGGSQEETNIYDTFDCPVCGCQYIAQERKRQANSETLAVKNFPEEESEELSEEELVDELEDDESACCAPDNECEEEKSATPVDRRRKSHLESKHVPDNDWEDDEEDDEEDGDF